MEFLFCKLFTFSAFFFKEDLPFSYQFIRTLFLLITFIYLLLFYWSIVDLRFVNFCCTAKWFSYTYIYLFFFWPCHTTCGILIPQPGIETVPLHWKHKVLTTRPPGKPYISFLKFFSIMVYHKNSLCNQLIGTLVSAICVKGNLLVKHLSSDFVFAFF